MRRIGSIRWAFALVALILASCATAQPAGSPSTAPASARSASAQPSAVPSVVASGTAAPVPSAEASEAAQAAVVEPPAGLLPPGSEATVTADRLRVRGAAPGVPGHEEVLYTLNSGDVVLVDWSPLAYISPEESPDGRGWYSVHVGGSSVMSYIDGGINGWVAAGENGLEYLEHEPVSCGSARDLENLVFSPFTGGDQERLTTPWERLACNGDRALELKGVFEIFCNEGGNYPYTFEPHLAVPQWCTGLIIDAIDADGFAQYAPGLAVRFPEFAPTDLERGDLLTVQGHFDDPAATSCTAEAGADFGGLAVDPAFLVLFCREQFVPDSWEVTGHRDLAPAP